MPKLRPRYIYDVKTGDYRSLSDTEYVVEVPPELYGSDEVGDFLANWTPVV